MINDVEIESMSKIKNAGGDNNKLCLKLHINYIKANISSQLQKYFLDQASLFIVYGSINNIL